MDPTSPAPTDQAPTGPSGALPAALAASHAAAPAAEAPAAAVVAPEAIPSPTSVAVPVAPAAVAASAAVAVVAPGVASAAPASATGSPAQVAEAPGLPPWAEGLRHRYLAGESVIFLLHGAVGDLQPGPKGYQPLRAFLAESLVGGKEVVMTYDAAEGLRFRAPNMRERFFKGLNAALMLAGQPTLTPDDLPREASLLLPYLERYFAAPGTRAALVLEYVEALLPAGELNHLGRDERANLITLLRWARDPAMLAGDNLVLLVAERLADLNPRLTSCPQIAHVAIPMPELEARTAFLRLRQSEQPAPLELALEQVARLTSGLSLVQLDHMLRAARRSGQALDSQAIAQRRKAVIEAECFGLVELLESQHGLEAVGGLEGPKAMLRMAAEAMQKGKARHVPMGVMLLGPMGTGKSFLAAAFAKECGLTCLAMKNFRDKWVGSTEANLEKIITVVRALGQVMVVIDEVERAVGGEDGDSGTSSRVFAKLKAVMADTSLRGSVLWVVMTNRPDKMDADLKRPGRFDLKIPLFPPKLPAERQAVAEALIRKNRLELEDPAALEHLVAATEGCTGAELEALLLLADREAALSGASRISAEHLSAAQQDFVPNRDRHMTEFMELLAVFECSSRRLLPEAYKAIPDETLRSRLATLKLELGLK